MPESTTLLKPFVRKLLPRRVGPHRILNGPIRGARIMTSWHDYPGAILGTTESWLLGWIASNVQRGETWLDVGAHYGYTAVALCKSVGPEGRVFAFEPVVKTAGYLKMTGELNGLDQLVIAPLGLGPDEPLSLITTSIDRGMAVHKQDNSRAEHMFVIGFDRLWPIINRGESQVHGIKIDVQGMETDTISGMASTLRHFHPTLVLEFHTGVDRGRIRQVLRELGYDDLGRSVAPDGERSGQYRDDFSYVFTARTRA